MQAEDVSSNNQNLGNVDVSDLCDAVRPKLEE